MAGIDKKLTDLTELTTPSDGSFIHVVEPLDISQSPDGSSYKVKKSNFGGLSDAPSNGTTYGRKDADWVAVSSTDNTADHLKGNWNASTNSPTLTNGIGQIGDYYIVSVSGIFLGISWVVGDLVSYNGTTWYRMASNDTSVITTNVNITSVLLSTQDVAGFVAYINALVSSFSVAINEEVYYTVTDTGQKFLILLRGRSFGGSEPDITTSDVLEIEPTNIWDSNNFSSWKILRADALGGAQSAISFTNGLSFINDGTTTTKTSTYNTGNFIDTVRRIGLTTTSAAAGSSIQRRISTGIPCSAKSGFYVCIDSMAEDAAPVATAADLVGLGNSFSALFGNVEPSTSISCVLLAHDSTDTNMQIMHNDTSGTCTKINLGSNFPANTTSTDLYRLELFCAKDGTKIHYKVTRINTGHVSEGFLTTNIPATNIPLTLGFWRCNRGTALAVTKSFSQISIATPY